MKLNLFKPKEIISQKLLTYLLFELPREEDGKLPAASFFAEKYGVSIVTIREILKTMESAGILSMHHGRGIYLNHPETIIREMIETRILIEGFCAGRAALSLSEKDTRRLEELASLLETAIQSGNMELYTDADFLFHMTIAGIGGNLVLEKTLRNIRIFLYVQQLKTNKTLLESHEKSLMEHRDILDSILRRDESGAEQAMRSHLEKTMSLWSRS